MLRAQNVSADVRQKDEEMKDSPKKSWLEAKAYGYGVGLPASWEGWVAFKGYFALILVMLVALVAGCRIARHGSTTPAAQTPVKLNLNSDDAPTGLVRIRSGQMIELELGCPPVELRDAKGRLLRELEYTKEPQPLVAAPGRYSIVGYDPGGEECAVGIEVTGD